jgi:hypothetical protein
MAQPGNLRLLYLQNSLSHAGRRYIISYILFKQLPASLNEI